MISAGIRKIVRAKTPATSVVQTLLMRLLVAAVSLLIGVITARSFGPAGRGEQSAIGLWPWVIVGFSTLGVPAALRYHVSRDRRHGGRLLAASLVIAALAGIVAAAIGATIVPQVLARRYPADVVASAQFMMAFVPAFLLFASFRSYLEANGDFRKSNTSALLTPLFTLAGLAALSALHRLTPLTANLAVFSPVALQTVWLAVKLRTAIPREPPHLAADMRRLLSYGIRTYGSDIVSTLSLQADQAVIVAYLSPASLGLYTVALMASRTPNMLQLSLNAVLFPTASGLAADAALDMVLRASRIGNALSAVVTALFMAVVPVVLPLFYGRDFQSAADITRILMIEAFLGGASSVLAQGFLATGRPGVVTIVQGMWLVSSLSFLTVLVPRMGIGGAACALVLSSALRLASIVACYPLVLHRSVPRLAPLRSDLLYLRGKLRAYRHAP